MDILGCLCCVHGEAQWMYWEGLACLHGESEQSYWGERALFMDRLSGRIGEVWTMFIGLACIYVSSQ